jgi:hypothetical protein
MSDERATPDPDEPDLGLASQESGRRKVDVKPSGLPMTPSARRRLELVLDERPSSRPPTVVEVLPVEEPSLKPPAIPREALETKPVEPKDDSKDAKARDPKERDSKRGKPVRIHARFGESEAKQLRRLARWVGLCALLALGTGGIASAGALLGRPGVVAHAIVGILAGALGVWLGSAAYNFWRMARRPAREVHRLIDGLGLLRTALLLKAILLFTTLTLGCFTFSLAAALLFLPG